MSPLLLSKKILGIDIGTAGIKLVELSGRKGRRKLENYGAIEADAISEKAFRTFEKSTLSLSSREVARAIKAIMEEAKIKTRDSIFSVPDFSSFFTNFELPPMTKEELSQAVLYEARQHVPLPLGEVTLDWEVIDGENSDSTKTKANILLVAVPNEVINQYREIAQLIDLKLLALEAEVFGLVRSLISAGEKKNKVLSPGEEGKSGSEVVAILDIGAQTTTCSIIDKRVLKASHSFNISGDDLTERLTTALSIDYKEAEKLKEKYGLADVSLPSVTEVGATSIKEILLPLIDVILTEVEKISHNFYQTEGREVQKFIIAGATANMPGIREYFENYLKKEVEIANPFFNVFYPPILEQTLKKMGPSFAIAVGMALKGLE